MTSACSTLRRAAGGVAEDWPAEENQSVCGSSCNSRGGLGHQDQSAVELQRTPLTMVFKVRKQLSHSLPVAPGLHFAVVQAGAEVVIEVYDSAATSDFGIGDGLQVALTGDYINDC